MHAPPRPREKWLPRTALAPKIFKTAPPHPENAPSLTVAPPRPEDFDPCPALPNPIFFILPSSVPPRPEAKKTLPHASLIFRTDSEFFFQFKIFF